MIIFMLKIKIMYSLALFAITTCIIIIDVITACIYRRDLTSQPIWHRFLSCSSSDSCINDCQTCPTNISVSCNHSEDVAVSCSEIELQQYYNVIVVTVCHTIQLMFYHLLGCQNADSWVRIHVSFNIIIVV